MLVKEFPTFEIGDFIMREKQETDLEAFYQYYTDPIVNEYILSTVPKNLDEARYELKYWRNVFYRGDGLYFAIAEKKTDKMIGSVGLTTYSKYHNRIELSYDMAKEYWGRGIMSAAVRKLVDFNFKTLGINRLEAVCSTFNERSIRLLEKCGFSYEGKLRQHRFHRGKYVDVYSFSILKEEYL